MRFFIKLAYRGEPFHGWQSQPNAVTVQSVLEDALSTLTRNEISVVGAGRTDAGVNANEMFAHFDLDVPFADKSKAILSLNRMLGRDIAVYDIFRVRDDAHARFDALKRTYKYFVTEIKSPFLYPLSWQATSKLDYELMNEAAEILLDTDDFTSFSKLHTDVKTNICNVTHAHWDFVGGQWVFTISADRFLRNMVRAVVGTLVDVGRGKLSIVDFKNIIEAHDRCAAGTSMPGNALFLWKIDYPQDIRCL